MSRREPDLCLSVYVYCALIIAWASSMQGRVHLLLGRVEKCILFSPTSEIWLLYRQQYKYYRTTDHVSKKKWGIWHGSSHLGKRNPEFL